MVNSFIELTVWQECDDKPQANQVFAMGGKVCEG